MAIQILTFEQAYKDSAQYSGRHLLLGNGFSIACIPQIFTYKSLFEQADFSDYPQIKELFKRLGTEDFELVINSLEHTGRVLPIFHPELTETVELIQADALKIKEILIKTIADRHPARPNDIEPDKFQKCRKFLASFLTNKDGKIYTLNYDLLLYWTLMHDEGDVLKIKHNDGFGRDTYSVGEETYASDFVTWQGSSQHVKSNVLYLHGALHLFDKGSSLEKIVWDNQKPLVEQAREALTDRRFPLFVAEGNWENKMKKITHHNYLSHAFKSFALTMKSTKTPSCCLFTYGVSFSENDSHILSSIKDGRINHLYIGLHGSPESNEHVIREAEFMQGCRKEYPLRISYYDTATARAWA